VWSGAASGTGETIEVTFDSEGSETLTAKCGCCENGKNVTITVVKPEVDAVTYGGGNHQICDVSPPEYSRSPAKNEPACWTINSAAVADVSFWHSQALSYATGNIVVRAETSGDDGFDVGDWGDSAASTFGTSWPSDNITCALEGTICEVIHYHDYNAQWKYKVTNGTNQWIETTLQSDCRLYAVLDTPQSPEAPPHEEILEYACNWASGWIYKEEACDAVVCSFANHYNWNGTCYQLASDFVRLVASLGVIASENRWSSRGQAYYSSDTLAVGDMYVQRTRSIDPVGSGTESGIIEWLYHEWAQAEGNQYDPSTGTHYDNATWGDYEDWLYTDYWEISSISPPYIYGGWVAEQAGQGLGCEASSHRHYESSPAEVLQNWYGPPGP